MTAISRSKVKIAIMNVDTNPSTVSETDFITGEIKSYDVSGFERDTESDPHFGGYVDKEKPVTQGEISLEITPSLGDSSGRWEALARSTDVLTGVYTLAGDVADKSVFIQAGNDTDGYASMAYNNVNVTTLDMSHNADDNRMYTFNLKLSPVNESGVSNYMSAETDLASLPAWTALDNND